MKNAIETIHNNTLKNMVETLNKAKEVFEAFLSKNITSGSELDKLIQYLLQWQLDYQNGHISNGPGCVFPNFDNDFFGSLTYLAQGMSGATGTVYNPYISWKKFHPDTLQEVTSCKEDENSFPVMDFMEGDEKCDAGTLLKLIVNAKENRRLSIHMKEKAIENLIASRNLKNKYLELCEKHPDVFLPTSRTLFRQRNGKVL